MLLVLLEGVGVGWMDGMKLNDSGKQKSERQNPWQPNFVVVVVVDWFGFSAEVTFISASAVGTRPRGRQEGRTDGLCPFNPA